MTESPNIGFMLQCKYCYQLKYVGDELVTHPLIDDFFGHNQTLICRRCIPIMCYEFADHFAEID